MTALILNMLLGLVRRYGLRLLALGAGYLAGHRSAQAGDLKRTIRNVEQAGESDRAVRDAVHRGDGGRLRSKWSRRE